MNNKNKCQICKEMFDDSDTYEYRGFMFCDEHFDEGIKKVDEKRSFVMETTTASVQSEREGAFINGHEGKFAKDGLPIVKVKEPLVTKEYEKGIL